MPLSKPSFLRLAALLVMLAATLPGIGAAADKKDGQVLAEMGETRLTVGQFRKLLASLDAGERQQVLASPKLLEKMAGEEVVKQYLIKQAKQEGVDRKPEVQFSMSRAADQALLSRFMALRTTPEAAFPDESMVQAAYEKNRDKLTRPERFHLMQLYLAHPASLANLEESEKRVGDLRSRLEREDFSQLAKTFSEHKPSADQGGDMGWLELNTIQPLLRPIIVALRPGEVSQVVKTDQGWHIFKLVAREAGKPLTFEEARPALTDALRRGSAKSRENALLNDALQRAPLKLNREVLSGVVGK